MKKMMKKPEIHVSISLWRIFITLVSGEVGFNCTYLEICGWPRCSPRHSVPRLLIHSILAFSSPATSLSSSPSCTGKSGFICNIINTGWFPNVVFFLLAHFSEILGITDIFGIFLVFDESGKRSFKSPTLLFGRIAPTKIIFPVLKYFFLEEKLTLFWDAGAQKIGERASHLTR